MQAELPKYKCHKEVHALQIKGISYDHKLTAMRSGEDYDGSAFIIPLEKKYAPFKVTKEYVEKHNPSTGGYYVVYDDGYESFSPAEAFERGYSLI